MIREYVAKSKNKSSMAEYTSDSDLSEDTRDLVSRGLASVKRKRITPASQQDSIGERLSVPNMDISSVRHPLWRDGAIGGSSTHGFASTFREIVDGQDHNRINESRIPTFRGSHEPYLPLRLVSYFKSLDSGV